MKKLTGFVVCVLLLCCAIAASAEITLMKSPKVNVFQVELSALMGEVPPMPKVEWEGDHCVISGLDAWSVDPEYLADYRVVYAPGGLEWTFSPQEERYSDRMVIYGEHARVASFTFRFSGGGRKFWGLLSFKGEKDASQETLQVRVEEKKTGSGFSILYSDNGRMIQAHNGNKTITAAANYVDGLLDSGYYSVTSGKVMAQYRFRNCGPVNGELHYELNELMVLVKGKEGWDWYRENSWTPVVGWLNPKDKTISKIKLEKLPFSLESSAGTAFSWFPAAQSSQPGRTAEDLSALTHTPDEHRLCYTLEQFGLPDMPVRTEEQAEDGSKVWRVTGLKRWGAPEDEYVFPQESDESYTYQPDFPQIREVSVGSNQTSLSVGVSMGSGYYICVRHDRECRVTADFYGKARITYIFQDGYLNKYEVAGRSNGSYEYDIEYTFQPPYTINENIETAGLKPEFSCKLIRKWEPGSAWIYQQGQWFEETDGIPQPLPVSEDRIPAPFEWLP